MAFKISNSTIIDDSRNIINAASATISGVTTASRFVSNVAQGTAPFEVTSNTLVTNLNADLLDGQSGSYYLNAGNLTGTAPAAVITQSNGLTISGNLNVSGNISIGGTSTTINTDLLTVEDKNIVIGLTTNASGADVSTDNTSNFGGISIASTEGTPLINIPLITNINTTPSTYKQFVWVKSGTMSGFNQDAWLTNYGISIGNTATVQSGSRLTVGVGLTVFDSYLTAQDIRSRNINAGVVTATTFNGSGSGITGVPVSTGISGLGANVATFLATPTSSNLAAAVTDETGSGSLVFATSPSLTTPSLGAATATSINKVSITAPATGSTLTIANGKTLTASNTLTFTGTDGSSVAFGTGGTVLYNGGPLGTPSSGTLTNCTGLPVATGISGLGANIATFLATPTSANLAAAVTDEAGTGSLVFSNNATLVSPNIGSATASSLNVSGIVTFSSGISDQNGSVGAANSVLTSNGSGGWTWRSVTSIGAISGININNDTTTATPEFLLFTSSSTGSVTSQDVSSTKLTYIPSSGSLGVNTSSPTQNLHVQGNVRITGGIYDNNNNVGSASSVLTANGSGGFSWQPVTAIGAIGGVSITDDNTGLRYPMFAASASASTAAHFIDTNGIVYNTNTNCLGIGSLTPTSNLDIVGNAKVVGVVTATDFNSSSDIRLKTNIANIENPLDKVLSINGVTFEWKETGKKSAGVIAQEIEAVLPDLVSESDGTKKVNYNGLIGLLVECIKDQQKQIDELKSRL